MSRRILALIAVLAISLAILTGLAIRRGVGGDTSPVAIGGPFQLVDTSGRTVGQELLKGKWSVMFFGFTHCPDVCPTTLDLLAQVHTVLKKTPPYGTQGQVVFVSVDPERDTPAQLAQYVHYFHKDFIGVTGADSDLKPLTQALGVLFMKVAQGGPDYTVDHSAGIFFIDPAGRLVSVLTPPHTADAVIARFKAVSAFILGKS